MTVGTSAEPATGDTDRRRLAGRRAVVTGASRGIGAGILHRLAAEGADVVGVARTVVAHNHLEGTLPEVVERARRFGTTVESVQADLSDESARDGLIDRCAQALGGPIDILVNNAAAGMYHRLIDYPAKRRKLTFELNLHAPLDLAQQAIPAMIEAGEGWIVNVSSATAKLRPGPPFVIPEPGTAMAMYGSSKAALNRLTNGLGAELYGRGIRVNTIEPRFGVLTEGAEALVGQYHDQSIFESMEQMVEGTLALCDCPAEVTGGVLVSLDLIDGDLIRPGGLTVHNLDGRPIGADPADLMEA